MADEQNPDRPVDVRTRAQIERIVDPDNQGALFLSAAQWLPSRFFEPQIAQMREVYAQQRRIIEIADRSIRLLVPRGWGFASVDLTVLAQACELVDRGEGGRADELLAEQWDAENRLAGRVVARIGVLGAPDRQMRSMSRQRERLVRRAIEHHGAGRYEASVPILLTQVEGITADVSSGRMFFSKNPRRAADLVDESRLVALEGALSALQRYYSEDVPETITSGLLSRHGVLHGRELAYDTKVNSAKALSLLDAVVEWAGPLSAAFVAERRQVKQQRNAGSQEVTAEGRRLDDREFAETRKALGLVRTSLMGVHRREGRFLSTVLGQLRGVNDFVACGLPAEHGVHLEVAPDGQIAWTWRETITGWVLALALVAEGDRLEEWLYAGAERPLGGPQDHPGAWDSVAASTTGLDELTGLGRPLNEFNQSWQQPGSPDRV